MGALGRGPGLGEDLAGAQAGGEAGDQRREPAHRHEPRAAFEGGGGKLDIILVLRRLALGETSDFAVGLGPDGMEPVEQAGPLGRAGGRPLLAQRRALEAVLRPPLAVEQPDPAQGGDVEDVVAALPAIASSMSPSGRPKARRRRSSTSSGGPSDVMASGERAQRRRKPSAPPSPSRWLSAWMSAIRPSVAALLRPDEHPGQGLAGEQLLLAPLERPEAGNQPRLGRKGGEQALGEGVDGLDAQAPAGGVEHPGEEAAGAGARFGAVILAEGAKLRGELGVLQPNPVREPPVDPVGHLGGAGLGEGEAEDRGGIDPGEQQAEDPGGEDVGLAGPRRGRERGMVARGGGVELLGFEPGEGAEAAGHWPPCSPRSGEISEASPCRRSDLLRAGAAWRSRFRSRARRRATTSARARCPGRRRSAARRFRRRRRV